jgi:hypothetical protein
LLFSLLPGPLALMVVAPTFPRDLGAISPATVTVVLEVRVSAQGLVEKAAVVECEATSACGSALRAIVGWRFQPGSAATIRARARSSSVVAGT